MKIEYLESGSPDCPLIRIYGNNCGEFSTLADTIIQLHQGSIQHAVLTELTHFEGIDGCILTAAIGHEEGVSRFSKEEFRWSLSQSKWSMVADLISPFTRSHLYDMHQWLSGKEAIALLNQGIISILISTDPRGSW
jgi:hypothetical protein